MRSKAGKRSRSDITENKEHLKRDMEGKEDEMEVPVEDHETVGDVMDAIEYGFTSEGGDEVEGALHDTQDATADVVEQEANELEQSHDESEGFEHELRDGSDLTTSDRDKVTDTRRKVKTDATQRGVERSLESIQQELDYLKEHFEGASEDRTESKRVEDGLRARVQKSRR